MRFYTKTNTKKPSTAVFGGIVGTALGAALGALLGAIIGTLGAWINDKSELEVNTLTQMNATGQALLLAIVGMIAGAIAGLEKEGFVNYVPLENEHRWALPAVLGFLTILSLPTAGGAFGHLFLKNKPENTLSLGDTALYSFEGGLILEVGLVVVSGLLTCLCRCGCINWHCSDDTKPQISAIA